ncbi:hypothetical protein SO694_00018226 [Aureococcus anophagefferens]|uniref:Uncharacterized protein n=1 Tax=Aureococcus anophagefferens TaxID=44056 RepID=A0ABR1G0G0_AURAN
MIKRKWFGALTERTTAGLGTPAEFVRFVADANDALSANSAPPRALAPRPAVKLLFKGGNVVNFVKAAAVGMLRAASADGRVADLARADVVGPQRRRLLLLVGLRGGPGPQGPGDLRGRARRGARGRQARAAARRAAGVLVASADSAPRFAPPAAALLGELEDAKRHYGLDDPPSFALVAALAAPGARAAVPCARRDVDIRQRRRSRFGGESRAANLQPSTSM